MSSQITTAEVEQYKSNVLDIVQQKGSRLRGGVMVDSDINGKRKFTDQVGTTEAIKRTTRHGDSPLVNTPHLRRALTLVDYEWGDLIDQADKIRLLIDPESAYVRNAAYAMGRAMDDEIVAAFKGTSYTGVDGTTAVDWTSATYDGQRVAASTQDGTGSSDTGLNVAKLRSARKILAANEVDPSEELFCAINAQMMSNLLSSTEVGSFDYNGVKALVQGDVDTFMGFKFIRSERLGTLSTGGTDESCICWAKSGLELGIGADVRTFVSPRPDKAFSDYVFLSMSLGATRIEEEKIVEIACDPTAGVTAA